MGSFVNITDVLFEAIYWELKSSQYILKEKGVAKRVEEKKRKSTE